MASLGWRRRSLPPFVCGSDRFVATTEKRGQLIGERSESRPVEGQRITRWLCPPNRTCLGCVVGNGSLADGWEKMGNLNRSRDHVAARRNHYLRAGQRLPW